jgi:DNA replication protein DnaC
VCKGECPAHGHYEALEMLVAGEWKGNACPKCMDEKGLEEKASREKVQRQMAITSAMKNAGIPKRFQEKSFEDYKTGNDKGKKRALNICEGYAENFDQVSVNGTSMVMCGKPGTGKSHLACSIGNHLIRSLRTVCFIGAVAAVGRVKETYGKQAIETERSVIEWLAGLDLLILDEIGVQFGTDTERMILFQIINKRYEEMKPTLIISNLAKKELAAYVGGRVMDRLKEGGGPVLAFDWESYR